MRGVRGCAWCAWVCVTAPSREDKKETKRFDLLDCLCAREDQMLWRIHACIGFVS